MKMDKNRWLHFALTTRIYMLTEMSIQLKIHAISASVTMVYPNVLMIESVQTHLISSPRYIPIIDVATVNNQNLITTL